MEFFAVGLQFLNLIPLILQIINVRHRRNINEANYEEIMADFNMYSRLGHMWLQLMAYFLQWLRKRSIQKQRNPHILISLLAGYRYVPKWCHRSAYLIVLVFI